MKLQESRDAEEAQKSGENYEKNSAVAIEAESVDTGEKELESAAGCANGSGKVDSEGNGNDHYEAMGLLDQHNAKEQRLMKKLSKLGEEIASRRRITAKERSRETLRKEADALQRGVLALEGGQKKLQDKLKMNSKLIVILQRQLQQQKK